MAQLLAQNPNVDPNVIIAAPLFYSKDLNSGEYNASQLAWGDLDTVAAVKSQGAWQQSCRDYLMMFIKCSLYNTWRYGLDDFDIPPFAGRKPYQYFSNYATRDVVTLAGLLDIYNEGDQYCMALLQGGTQRIQRNLAYWKYINLLGGTQNDVSNYPGNFSNLPDWSRHLSRPFAPRLVISANWSHDVQIFGSDEGVSALFDTQLVRGWLPGDSPLLPTYANISDDPPPNGGAALISGPLPSLLLLFPTISLFLTTFMTVGLFDLL
ncbi:hypothetical protein MNAN1_002497 [Malassezia nana]|uniref:Uncharacterized protein n=1 Tax=Malassezia nana TaxID=180528 RepID=A0AAF0EN23_9BASI|nr:hypothetical protein MNAN1_002497 [Malassezia nana]